VDAELVGKTAMYWLCGKVGGNLTNKSNGKRRMIETEVPEPPF
jgi:hypothetical protein